MINKVKNIWLNRIEYQRKLIAEPKKAIVIPSIYNTKADKKIGKIVKKLDYQI
jgi:hypothetical protein